MRRFQPLLLALALILGQAAALAHTSQHPITNDSQHVCTLCLLQHNLDHAPLTPAPIGISLQAGVQADLPAALVSLASSTDAHYPIRAPPASV